MKRHWSLAAALLFVVVSTLGCNSRQPEPAGKAKQAPREETVPPETDPGRITVQVFKDYQKEVVSLLKAALAGGGTAAAVEVCKGVSAQITEKFKSMPGASVRRVAVKYRNPAHKPDDFEAGIFEEWEALKAKGEFPTAISRQTPDGLRVMQPIMLGARLCLRCHGTSRDIAPDTAEMLAREYPNDRATGFKMGDIRGAFSATIKSEKQLDP